MNITGARYLKDEDIREVDGERTTVLVGDNYNCNY